MGVFTAAAAQTGPEKRAFKVAKTTSEKNLISCKYHVNILKLNFRSFLFPKFTNFGAYQTENFMNFSKHPILLILGSM